MGPVVAGWLTTGLASAGAAAVVVGEFWAIAEERAKARMAKSASALIRLILTCYDIDASSFEIACTL
jgi:hypothetical protein